MLGHGCGHQASLPRSLEAPRAACSTSIVGEISSKSNKNQQKSSKCNGNQWESMKINENSLFPLFYHAKVLPHRRLARPQRATSTVPDVSSHIPVNIQCRLRPQNGRRVANPPFSHKLRVISELVNKNTHFVYIKKRQDYIVLSF